MSGHLSAEEKAAFKAGVLSARKQDYALFIAFLEVNNTLRNRRNSDIEHGGI
jgi:hypothetical protein